MLCHIKERGYPKSMPNRAVNIANKTPREKLLQENPDRKKTNRGVDTPNIKNIVAKHLLVLFNDPIYAKILANGVKTVSDSGRYSITKFIQ